MTLPVGRRFHSLVVADGGVALRTEVVRPRAGEPKLLLAPSFVGVCRSDLKEVAGERAVRRDFGHELVAEVVASDPPGLLAGATVCLDPHRKVARTSGFAELIEISGPERELLGALPVLPGALRGEVGVFVEPLACAVHCVRRWRRSAPARPSPHVAVVGAGMAGTLIAAVLQLQGARVTLWNRSAQRLAELRDREALPGVALRSLRSDAPDERFDAAILATSMLVRDVCDWALGHLRPGGEVVLYAGTDDGIDGIDGVDVDAVRRGERRLRIPGAEAWAVGSHGAEEDDFRAAVELLASGGNGLAGRLERLIAGRITLAEAAEVIPAQVEAAPFGKTVVALAPGTEGEAA